MMITKTNRALFILTVSKNILTQAKKHDIITKVNILQMEPADCIERWFLYAFLRMILQL